VLKHSILGWFFGESGHPARTLGELADIKGGKRVPKGQPFADRSTPYPYIRVVDFAEGSINTSGVRYLTDGDYEAIQRYVIRTTDVYISIAGTTGLVGTIPDQLDGANLTENAARIVVHDPGKLSHRFLYWYLASEAGQSHIRLRTTKTSQPKLALMRIAEIPVPVPPIRLQRDVAATLDVAQSKILAEQRAEAALSDVFSSVLCALLGDGI
jgi:type I restriction enzyme S subunit